MSKKVPGVARLADYDERYAREFKDEIFVTIEIDGDEAYRNSYDTKTDAAEADETDEAPAIVATYKLVKVEYLRVKRKVEVVEDE